MNTQYIQKMMDTIYQEILIPLYEMVARVGCGLGGISID